MGRQPDASYWPAPLRRVQPRQRRRCQRLALCYDGAVEKEKDKADAPKQKQSLADYWVSLGMKDVTRPGRGVVIGTGRPVEKKDDEAK
jgi:hypothetical protein